MNLKQLRLWFENRPAGETLTLGLSYPFSWRGSYNEVAFTLDYNVGVAESLVNIDRAMLGEFQGWKGGMYEYTDYTTVNFEVEEGGYSDKQYVKDKMKEIGDSDPIYEMLMESL